MWNKVTGLGNHVSLESPIIREVSLFRRCFRNTPRGFIVETFLPISTALLQVGPPGPSPRNSAALVDCVAGLPFCFCRSWCCGETPCSASHSVSACLWTQSTLRHGLFWSPTVCVGGLGGSLFMSLCRNLTACVKAEVKLCLSAKIHLE